jgi:AIPR protein/abortive infection phage resistance-like protein
MDELLEYKKDIYNTISIDSDTKEVFPEESYFEYVSEILSNAGIIDDVQYSPYKNTKRGIRIDGYSWNALEKTVYGILVIFTNEPDVVDTLTNTQINDLGKKVTRFFENIGNQGFIESLEVTDPGRIAASDIEPFVEEAIKFRVLIFTDQKLSTRVKKVSIEDILGKNTSIEIWDIERLKALEKSDSEYEEFTVDLDKLGGGVRVLPANISEQGFRTYLGVMPAKLLSVIYDEFGQRLLESNVRTFLDFRAGTNKGMRKSLLIEPEHFFAYNNGITITSTSIQTRENNGQLQIISMDNMQIVNGGQTTASIYFSPREKGGIKGIDGIYNYSDIDLNKVFVQMKLTVIEDIEIADEMKANIATYANSQNSIQQSDLVSNHPFHLNIETRSRKQLMPAGENGLSTKWFYERARGQYSTQLRALTSMQKRKFQTEYPKKQVFTKTDMAKYENTWRMKPYFVKKGAQANLKVLSTEIIKEFDKNENAFGPAFYNDLVSKMILFRMSDAAILQADWYKQERGLKAEIVTYSIALLRHALLSRKKDINLTSIYRNQSVSETMLNTIVSIAKDIRKNITDFEFTNGVTNPSEFCKSEKGWKKIQTMDVDLSALGDNEILSAEQTIEAEKDRKDINEASKSISGLEYVMGVTAQEWELIAEYFAKTYPYNHKNVGIPRKCNELHQYGKMPSDKQLNLAKEIREEAYNEGFDYVG